MSAQDIAAFFQTELERELDHEGAEKISRCLKQGVELDDLLEYLFRVLETVDLQDDSIPVWCVGRALLLLEEEKRIALEVGSARKEKFRPVPQAAAQTAPAAQRAPVVEGAVEGALEDEEEVPASVTLLTSILARLRGRFEVVAVDKPLCYNGQCWRTSAMSFGDPASVSVRWRNRIQYVMDSMREENVYQFAYDDVTEGQNLVLIGEQAIGYENKKIRVLGILTSDGMVVFPENAVPDNALPQDPLPKDPLPENEDIEDAGLVRYAGRTGGNPLGSQRTGSQRTGSQPSGSQPSGSKSMGRREKRPTIPVDSVDWILECNGRLKLCLNQACCVDDSFVGEGHIVLVHGIFTTDTGDHRPTIYGMKVGHPLQHIHQIKKRIAIQSREEHDVAETMKELREVRDSSLTKSLWIILNNCMFDRLERLEYITEVFNYYEKHGVRVDDPEEVWDNLQDKDAIPLPVGFVLMGNFSSYTPEEVFVPTTNLTTQMGYVDNHELYLNTWQMFYDLVSKHPKILENCKILLVPGPNDPGIPLLPRGPIVEPLRCYVDKELNAVRKTSESDKKESDKRESGKVIFTANPVMIRSMDHDFMILRTNICHYMKDRTYLWYRPKALEDDINSNVAWDAFIRTVVGQGHLLPLPDPYPSKVAYTQPHLDSQLYLTNATKFYIYGDRFCEFNVTKVDETVFANVPNAAVLDITGLTVQNGWKLNHI